VGLLATWRDTFEVALKEIGDISGFTVFDAGPEGYASRVLAQRIGDGRIIGVNLWLGFYKAVRKMVGAKLMKKLVLIYDDMKRMNYIKDSFFDLVVSYETMASIERETPKSTLPILRQFYRILKQNGRFLAVENLPVNEVKPIDEAQALQIKSIKILNKLVPIKVSYNVLQLSKMLRQVGFENIDWKLVSEGDIVSSNGVIREIEGLKSLVNEVIKNQGEREEYLNEIQEIDKQVKKIGLRTLPYYALYARKIS
jgi:ubiquinone/menaquinone biosynthesis C-methylase UbiE